MTYRSGVSQKNNKPWSGYFCPAPKGTSDACPPIFDKQAKSPQGSFAPVQQQSTSNEVLEVLKRIELKLDNALLTKDGIPF